MKSIILKLIFLFLIFQFAANAQIVRAYLETSNINPNYNDSITISVNFDMTQMALPDTSLGSFSCKLKWEVQYLQFYSHSGLNNDFTGIINTDSSDFGIIYFNGVNPFGVGSNFKVIDFNFLIIDYAGHSTQVQLDVTALAAAYTFNNLIPYLTVQNVTINVIPTSIKEEDNQNFPANFQLYQNYPNPFNPSTIIKFALPQKGKVKIEIYDSIGQKVEELLNESISAGYHAVQFDGSIFSSGVYFYKIEVGEYHHIKKMMLIK